MAIYEDFYLYSNGTSLTSITDFTGAEIGVIFEKKSGEIYKKISTNNIYDKYERKWLATTGDARLSGDFLPKTDNTINFGSDTLRYANIHAINFNGAALTARYADLAEKYETDMDYPFGTVVEVGGSKEVTKYNGGPLAGVISEKPALKMNESSKGQYVALKGKVPVFCEGDVKKGQYCIAKSGGKVYAMNKQDLFSSENKHLILDIVGVALEDSKKGIVEVKI